MLKFTANVLMLVALFLGFVQPVSAAPVEINLAPYSTRNIQRNLFPTFPTGHVIPPLNSFGIPFYIPASENNFLTIERDNPVTIHVGVLGVRKIFTLMQAYGPPAGDRICSVEFIGSAGADQTFNLIVGINVRDFFESCFSRTINNTTTQSAFEFIGRGGAYTDNTATGPRGFYDFDEQEYDLRQEFATQTLNSVKITTFSNWGTPFLLGLTAQTSAEPAHSSLSFLSSYRLWIIVSVCVLVLAIIIVGVGIQRWLNAP